MNKYNCDYYEVETEEISTMGSMFKEQVIVGERCIHENSDGACNPNSCTFHSDMKDPNCPKCQHGFFAQRQQRWMCEYPNEEERSCKSGRINFFQERWKILDPDFAPEFITEEEMKI